MIGKYTKEILLDEVIKNIVGALNLTSIMLSGDSTIELVRERVQSLIEILENDIDALDSIDELLTLQARFFD